MLHEVDYHMGFIAHIGDSILLKIVLSIVIFASVLIQNFRIFLKFVTYVCIRRTKGKKIFHRFNVSTFSIEAGMCGVEADQNPTNPILLKI